MVKKNEKEVNIKRLEDRIKTTIRTVLFHQFSDLNIILGPKRALQIAKVHGTIDQYVEVGREALDDKIVYNNVSVLEKIDQEKVLQLTFQRYIDNKIRGKEMDIGDEILNIIRTKEYKMIELLSVPELAWDPLEVLENAMTQIDKGVRSIPETTQRVTEDLKFLNQEAKDYYSLISRRLKRA